MSKSFILVKYSLIDTKICEEESVNIDSTDISDDMFAQLEMDKYIHSMSVLEETNGDSYEVAVVDNSHLPELIKKCEEIAVGNYCAELINGVVNDKDRNRLFNELTVFLSIREILNKKKLKFENNENVFIVLG